jgi:hypothetical protein
MAISLRQFFFLIYFVLSLDCVEDCVKLACELAEILLVMS